MRINGLAILSLAVGLQVAGFAAHAEPLQIAPSPRDACSVSEELTRDNATLPVLAERLRQGLPIKIVAIGGASTAGTRSPGRAAYPERLRLALALRFPRIEFSVVNRGVPRQTARQMVERIERDVMAENPNLVIWETGTNDAVRGVDIDEFSEAIRDGLELLRHKPLDIVVMDMQYSPNAESIINFPPYLDALYGVADSYDALVFRRFEIMKHWSDAGSFDFGALQKDTRGELSDRVYECLTARLADALERVAK